MCWIACKCAITGWISCADGTFFIKAAQEWQGYHTWCMENTGIYTTMRILIRSLVWCAYSRTVHDTSASLRALSVIILTRVWREFRWATASYTAHTTIPYTTLCYMHILCCMHTCTLQILNELQRWFDIPHNLVEVYLNYDMDRRFIQQWKVSVSIYSSCIAQCCARVLLV